MQSSVMLELPIMTCALHSLKEIIKESAKITMQKQERIIGLKGFVFEVVI